MLPTHVRSGPATAAGEATGTGEGTGTGTACSGGCTSRVTGSTCAMGPAVAVGVSSGDVSSSEGGTHHPSGVVLPSATTVSVGRFRQRHVSPR